MKWVTGAYVGYSGYVQCRGYEKDRVPPATVEIALHDTEYVVSFTDFKSRGLPREDHRSNTLEEALAWAEAIVRLA